MTRPDMPANRATGGRVQPGRVPGAEPIAPAGADQPILLAQIPAILYTASAGPNGRWHYVSPQIESILGFTPEEWCADPMLWTSRLHPDDVQRVIDDEMEALAGGANAGAAEYRLVRRDGRVVWLRDDAQLLTAPDGTRQWHGVLSDITDRKVAEAELERRAAQQAAVARLGEHALEGASITELCQETATVAAHLLDAQLSAVLELLPDGEAFFFRAFHGVVDSPRGPTILADRTTQSGYTLITAAPVVVADWLTETRFGGTTLPQRTGARSALTVPVAGRSAPFGVISLHTVERRDFSESDIAFAQAMANVLGDAFEHQLTEDDIRHRALHDTLTGLPNRALFMDRLQQAIKRLRRRDASSAVLFLDLDRFKLVNDSLGHEVGDELLEAAAPRLKQALRSSDTVARFGADEFAILLDEIAGEHDAIEMANRVAGVFTRPFVLAGTEHFVTTSIGIALAYGGERAEDLVRDADAAMHRAKERGRARYELFDEGIRGRAISRLRVENDLRRALERDELTLDYQPLVSLTDRSIVGVEALIRWEHPDRGRIAPADFIPVAEENGLIEPIGRWVLDHACRQAARWYRMRPDAAPIAMSVNLSAVQFRNRGLAETVAGALRAAALDPACLSLELTESVMVGDTDHLMETLESLKGLGVRLVLDDFGTGYSSLAYLTRLPFDTLKVDRSFIDGLGSEPRDTAVTEAIVAMAHALSLRVVGEGTETERQVAELTRLGCDVAQGYHFARPLPAREITGMLQHGPTWKRKPRVRD
jgi:diguanylate cyclase (GGDEF)-like protein/PAS domain S-box-containing protein